MKMVVVACLGILLMILGLGSCQNASRRSNDELFNRAVPDRIAEGCTIRKPENRLKIYPCLTWVTSDGLTMIEIDEGEEFDYNCPPNTRFGAIRAVWGLNDCSLDVNERVHFKCFGKMRCTFPVTNHFFGDDPCYLLRKLFYMVYKCWPKAEIDALQPAHGNLQYNPERHVTLHCPPHEEIKIVFAKYGYWHCVTDVTEKVTELCKGKSTCTLDVAKRTRFGSSCPDKWKRLDLYYRCNALIINNKRCWPKEAEPVRRFVANPIKVGHKITLICPPNTQLSIMETTRQFFECNTLSLARVENSCFGRSSCQIEHQHCGVAVTGTYKTPPMHVTYGCWPAEAKLGRTKVTEAFVDDIIHINCPRNKWMEIISAGYFFQYSGKVAQAHEYVVNTCFASGESCTFKVPDAVPERDSLSFGKMLLYVTYRCWPKEYWMDC